MNQKIINLVEKTQKKAPIYDTPKTKRFQRKRSQQSDRSIDSKRSRHTAYQQPLRIQQIPNIQSKNNKIHIPHIDFCESLANTMFMSKQLLPNKQRYARLRSDRIGQQPQISKQIRRQSTDYHSQALAAQLQVRNKQLQVIASELKLMKQSLKDQTQKVKKIQQQKKQIYCQLSERSKELQKNQIQNKKLAKQKQYLVKQIEFLQKINYDDKTRNAQSYRQKYLSKQIQQLRKQINSNKSQTQKHLENQIKRITDEKYGIQTLYKSSKLANQMLIKQIQKIRAQDKHCIYQSQQYITLREKYKKCLDAYRNLKIQYVELQKQLNRSLSNIPQHILNSNSQLSVVLSSSQSQKSITSIDKQNQHQSKAQRNKDLLFIQVQTPITPMKKSLSPRNRQQKPQINFKKPVSPKNTNKKQIQNRNISHQSNINNTVKAQKKYQKTSNYFNQAYRLKIGLGKLPTSDK